MGWDEARQKLPFCLHVRHQISDTVKPSGKSNFKHALACTSMTLYRECYAFCKLVHHHHVSKSKPWLKLGLNLQVPPAGGILTEMRTFCT